MVDVARSLEHVGIARKRDFYWALRALLVIHRDEIPVFDDAFRLFWRRPPDDWTTLDLRALGERRRFARRREERPGFGPSLTSPDDSKSEGGEKRPRFRPLLTYSAREMLRQRDFSDLSGEERDEVEKLIRALSWRAPRRRSRPPRSIEARPDRSTSIAATQPQSRRRGARMVTTRAQDDGSTDRRARRHQWLDAGLLTPSAAVHVRAVGGAAAARRGFPVRHPAHQGDSPAARRRCGTSARRGRTRRLRLVGRHANRRRDRALQPLVEPPRAHPEGDRAHHQRRLGPRLSPAPGTRDGPSTAQLSSPRLAEPAARLAGVRAGGAGHAGCAPLHRHVSAHPQPGRVWRSSPSCWPTSRRGAPGGGSNTRR